MVRGQRSEVRGQRSEISDGSSVAEGRWVVRGSFWANLREANCAWEEMFVVPPLGGMRPENRLKAELRTADSWPRAV